MMSSISTPLGGEERRDELTVGPGLRHQVDGPPPLELPVAAVITRRVSSMLGEGGVQAGHRFPHLRYPAVGEDGLHPLQLVPYPLELVRDDREHTGRHLADGRDAGVALDHPLAVGRVAERLLLQSLLDAPEFLADLPASPAGELLEPRR